MLNRVCSKHAGACAIGFGLIAGAIYLLMIRVTLAHIPAISGQPPFDMRPLGYSPTEAAALLEALGPQGRAYYLSAQIPLDTVYPAMMALTLIALMQWSTRPLARRALLRLGVVLAIGAAAFDYGENFGVALMLLGWPDLPSLLVSATSFATIIKSGLTTLAVGVTLALLFLRIRKGQLR